MVQQQRPGRYTIEAVANALSILDAIAGREVLGLGEAAEVAGVSKSTAYRLLATLEGADLVERLPEGGYRAGVGAVRWATQLLAQFDVRTVALPILRWLRDETGETVNLAVLREAGLVYVEIMQSPAAFRMADVAGAIAPIHATALGKAVAAHLEPTRLAALLGPEPYQRFTPRTLTSWRELASGLEEVRARGYSLDLEELEMGVACIAAPILVADQVAGALSVSGPRARMDDDQILQVGTLLVEATRRVAIWLAPTAAIQSGSTRSAIRPR
jgi:DNA-binding IclR family transcriptional regulator